MVVSDSSIQDAATPLRPVSASERIPAIDVLRGFALFGVLLAYAVWNLGSPPEDSYGSADRVLGWLLSALVDTKFYTQFAFLFGVGFSIQLVRAQSRGISIVPLYCRRLLVLLVIGLLHALLLRNGDILVPYAVMGFILLLFRNASNTTLAVGAIIGLLFPYLARAIWNLTDIPFPSRPEEDGLSYLADNFAWVRYWYSIAITSWPASLPMFLFGLYMGRRGFFDDLAANRRRLWQALILGLCIGALAFVASGLVSAMDLPSVARRVTSGLLWSAHAWGLAAFYVSLLLLLLQRTIWRRLLSPLAAVGTMALTNYLLQAMIIVPVCIGFGLFGRVTPSIGVMLALAVWSVQVLLSVWWLRHFRFGPAEWLWRSLTYGHIQPMRASAAPAVAAGG